MTRNVLVLLLATMSALVVSDRPALGMTRASGVSYTRQWVQKTRVHVIWVNLNDKSLKVTPTLAANQAGKRQSFISFLAEYQPLAQMTGSYFGLQNALPIGDIVVNGKLRHRGPVGSALALKPDNTAVIVNIPRGWKASWTGYESVLKGGVRLVQEGKFAVYPRAQGFRDPALFRRATRTAVGLDRRNHLLLVAVNKPIFLSELAGIMKALGCRDAMTMDGGTSTGLAFGSNVIMTPGRTLANVLMVVRRPPGLPVIAADTPAPAVADESATLHGELPPELNAVPVIGSAPHNLPCLLSAPLEVAHPMPSLSSTP